VLCHRRAPGGRTTRGPTLSDELGKVPPSQKKKTMSSEATAGQTPDVYGQLHPVETPELLKRKQKEFEEEMEKLSADEKKNILLAHEKCPELVADDFKLMFLRCEVYNADLAAKRYAAYWDKRVELFGR
jgi:hypothetical protein